MQVTSLSLSSGDVEFYAGKVLTYFKMDLINKNTQVKQSLEIGTPGNFIVNVNVGSGMICGFTGSVYQDKIVATTTSVFGE